MPADRPDAPPAPAPVPTEPDAAAAEAPATAGVAGTDPTGASRQAAPRGDGRRDAAPGPAGARGTADTGAAGRAAIGRAAAREARSLPGLRTGAEVRATGAGTTGAGTTGADAAGAMPEAPSLALLAVGRVHEATGPGRRSFAAALAGQAVARGAARGRQAGPRAAPGPGTVLWILEAREGETLCPAGLAPLLDPARLLIARPAGMTEVLQVAEEALRSGAVAMVIAELDAAPDLTASRRLQLAAGTGGSRGLCLVPESRLATNAAETRWHCSPVWHRAPLAVAEGGPGGAAEGAGRDGTPRGVRRGMPGDMRREMPGDMRRGGDHGRHRGAGRAAVSGQPARHRPAGEAAGETGGETGGRAAPHAPPGHGTGGALQHWELLKNKRGPLAAWQVRLAAPWPRGGGTGAGDDAARGDRAPAARLMACHEAGAPILAASPAPPRRTRP